MRAIDRRDAVMPGVLLVSVLSALVATFARWGPDWPAQEFRAWVAGHDGLSVFTTRWYGGSALPGYSVLYPPLAAVLGPGLLGVLSCVTATWAACGLAPRTSRGRAVLFGIAVAVSTTQNLLIGQVPFLLGTAFAVLALRAVLAGRHPALTASLAVLASLSSPLAGGFVLLVSPAVAVHLGWRRAVPLAAATAGSVVAAVVGGASGPFPCPWLTFAGVVGFCAAILVCVPRSVRAMHVFAVCYLAMAVLAFAVPNPIGGNVARLGKIIAIPLAVYFLATHTRRLRVRTALVAAIAFIWPTVAFTTSMVGGASDPSHNQQFYLGLQAFLHRTNGAGRVEIPFTRGHWETYFVARQFDLARGWERQSDLQYNAVLYRPLTASRYRTWLDNNAVSYVALARTAIDYGGQAEATLLRHPPAFLVPAWHDANWQVWRVVRPTPLVSGATLVDEDSSSMTLHFTAPGSALVRVHASNLWQAQVPGVCVVATRRDWLSVRSDHAGIVPLAARLNPTLITGPADCRP